MNTLELKAALHKEIETMSKSNLNYLYGSIQNIIRSNVDIEHWEGLTEAEKEGIAMGIRQAELGQLVSHDSVIQGIKQKYGIL
jgi:predicted transcriptional regulator